VVLTPAAPGRRGQGGQRQIDAAGEPPAAAEAAPDERGPNYVQQVEQGRDGEEDRAQHEDLRRSCAMKRIHELGQEGQKED
jgi:hypothetical protein